MERAVAFPRVSLAIVIDQACKQIFAAWREGLAVTGLRVSPEVYGAVAEARQSELAHGHPLMLLDLELEPDERVPTYDPVVSTARGAAGAD
jgi:hypothetical protein